ncbi:hypothetical protein O5282_00065 [Escherichia coli]|nr:hypothetical protein [Escherichia coli]
MPSTTGDPDRVEKIAALMDKPVKLTSHANSPPGVQSWMVNLLSSALPVSAAPSASVAVEELAQLGIRTFLRIGTTGAIQPHINVGDATVTTASVRLDGASLHFATAGIPGRRRFRMYDRAG